MSDSREPGPLRLQGIVAVYSDEKGARLALTGLWRVAGRRQWAGTVTALRRAHGGRLWNDAPRPLRPGPIGWLARAGTIADGARSWFRRARAVDAPLRDVGDRLTPGTSALVAAVEPEWARDVERWLAQGGADLITDLLAATTVAELAARARHPRSV